MEDRENMESEAHTSRSLSHYVTEDDDQEAAEDKASLPENYGEVDYVVALVFRHPAIVFLTLLAYCAMCTYFTAIYFNLSDPFAGLRLRDHPRAQKADGWVRALEESPFSLAESRLDYSVEVRRRALLGDEEGGRREEEEEWLARRRLEDQQSRGIRSIEIIFMTIDKSNLLTFENIQRIRDYEQRLLALSRYPDFCLLRSGSCRGSRSLMNFFPENLTTQEQIDDGVRTARRKEEYNTDSHFMKEFQSNQFPAFTDKTRSQFFLGRPLAGFSSVDDRKEKQEEKVLNFMLNDVVPLAPFESRNLRIVVAQTDLRRFLTTELLTNDMYWAAGAIGSVMVMMIIQMRSVFLGVMGIIQILFSLPLAFFVYRFVFDIELFGGLQVLAVFIIMGIGADDVFIYVEAVKQNFRQLKGPSWTVQAKFSAAYRAARFTMWTTTVTTGFAFALQAISIIPVIRYFGVLTSLMVFLNYFLVLTLYSCVLVFYVKYIARYKDNDDEKVDTHDFREGGSFSDRLFRDYYGSVVTNKYVRYTTLVLVTAFLCGMAYSISTLTISETEANPLPELHPVNLQLVLIPEAFLDFSGSATETMRIVHGLKDPYIDRTGTRETVTGDQQELGKPIYASASVMDLKDPSGQQHLFDFCYYPEVTTSGNELLIKPNTCKSPLTAFGLWRQARQEVFPIPLPVGAANSVAPPRLQISGLDSTYSIASFMQRPEWFTFLTYIGFARDAGPDGNDLRVRFTFTEVDFFISSTDPFTKRESVVNVWESFLNRLNSMGQVGLTRGFFTEFDYFVFYEAQVSFLNGALVGTALSFALALVIITLATNNLHLAILALLCIISIFLVVVGMITALGSQLDSVFSLCISILVGIAVDYVVHFAVAYNESKNSQLLQKRDEKTRFALYIMGVPILSGATTTLAAACFLGFPTTVTILSQFGFFFGTSIVIALMLGLGLFPILLATFGPEGRRGLLSTTLERRALNITDPNSHNPPSPEKERVLLGAFTVLTLIIFSVSLHAFYVIENGDDTGGGGVVLAETRFPFVPPVASLEPNLWTEMIPTASAATVCGRGGDYSFFFKRAQSDDVPWIIEFEGFGGCWSSESCREDRQAFPPNLDASREQYGAARVGRHRREGLADPEGPYGSFHHLVVPYCTADLYLGDTDFDYGSQTMRFRGARNAQFALDWLLVDSGLPLPEKIVVWGSSVAGGIGSLFWSSYVAEFLEERGANTRIVQFADSALGVFDPARWQTALEVWETFDTAALTRSVLPAELRDRDTFLQLTIPELYVLSALRFPSNLFIQYSSAYDFTQTNFLGTLVFDTQVGRVRGNEKRGFNSAMRTLYNFQLISFKLIQSLGIEFDPTYNETTSTCVDESINCTVSVFESNTTTSRVCIPFSCTNNNLEGVNQQLGPSGATVFGLLIDLAPKEQCSAADSFCDIVIDAAFLDAIITFASNETTPGQGNGTSSRILEQYPSATVSDSARNLQTSSTGCAGNVTSNCSVAFVGGVCADVTCIDDVSSTLNEAFGGQAGGILIDILEAAPKAETCDFDSLNCTTVLDLTNESSITDSTNALIEGFTIQVLEGLGLNLTDAELNLLLAAFGSFNTTDLLDLLNSLDGNSVPPEALIAFLRSFGLIDDRIALQLFVLAILGLPPPNYLHLIGAGDDGAVSAGDTYYFAEVRGRRLFEIVHGVVDSLLVPLENQVDCEQDGETTCEVHADLRTNSPIR